MEIISLAQVAITLAIGMFIGAGIMFNIMYRENNALEKELEIKSDTLQSLKDSYSEYDDINMINFAKFNTKHHKGCKTIKDKLELYKKGLLYINKRNKRI